MAKCCAQACGIWLYDRRVYAKGGGEDKTCEGVSR